MATKKQQPHPTHPGAWVRDHLANERTLLAWVRTSLAFMGFGIAIAKLSVLLQVDTLEHPTLAAELPDQLVSKLVGATLVALGGVISILGAIQARRWTDAIPGDAPSRAAQNVTVAVSVLMSVGLLIYLLV